MKKKDFKTLVFAVFVFTCSLLLISNAYVEESSKEQSSIEIQNKDQQLIPVKKRMKRDATKVDLQYKLPQNLLQSKSFELDAPKQLKS